MAALDSVVSIRSITDCDDRDVIANILEEAFAHEPLSKAVDYTEDEFKLLWKEAANLCSNGLCLAAVVNDVIVGVAIIEECPEELNSIECSHDGMTILDPIDMLLAEARDVFLKERNLRYQHEQFCRVLKMSFLAVSPRYFGRGIGGKLVSDITSLERDIFQNVRFVYSESSVYGSKRLCERYGWELWSRLSYATAWEKYRQAVSKIQMINSATEQVPSMQFKQVQPVQGEDDMWLQVLVNSKNSLEAVG